MDSPVQYGYITISVIAVLLNITVIYLFLTRKKLRNMHSNIFLFSLAISDLSYASTAIPLLIRCEQSKVFPSKLCLAYEYVMVFFGYSTVYHIILAIAEKLCAICFTMKHYSTFSRSIAIKLSLSVWLISIIFTHIPAWWDFILFPGKVKENGKRDEVFYKFNFTTAFAWPVLISVIMYSIILHKIFKAADARLTEDSSAHNNMSRFRVEKKAACTFLCMLAAFLFSWTTWFLARIHDSIVTSPSVYVFVTISKLLDPILNPLLYTFLKNDFRRAFLSLLRSKKRNNELQGIPLTRLNRHGTGVYTHEDTLHHSLHHHSMSHKTSRKHQNANDEHLCGDELQLKD